MKEKGILRIGTSGIIIPGSRESLANNLKHKSRLNYYSSLFNTIDKQYIQKDATSVNI